MSFTSFSEGKILLIIEEAKNCTQSGAKVRFQSTYGRIVDLLISNFGEKKLVKHGFNHKSNLLQYHDKLNKQVLCIS